MDEDEILNYSTPNELGEDDPMAIHGEPSSSGQTVKDQPSNKTNNHLYKVLVVGDYAVGKTR